MPIRKPRITDGLILAWIQSGLLLVTNDDTNPELWFRGRRIKPELTRQGGRRYSGAGEQCERWTWSIRYQGLRRKIVRGKLVWMHAHRTTVPEGCVVHHADEDRLNDTIDNLELLSEDQHSALHNPNQQEY